MVDVERMKILAVDSVLSLIICSDFMAPNTYKPVPFNPKDSLMEQVGTENKGFTGSSWYQSVYLYKTASASIQNLVPSTNIQVKGFCN